MVCGEAPVLALREGQGKQAVCVMGHPPLPVSRGAACSPKPHSLVVWPCLSPGNTQVKLGVSGSPTLNLHSDQVPHQAAMSDWPFDLGRSRGGGCPLLIPKPDILGPREVRLMAVLPLHPLVRPRVPMKF